ncbi:MAG: nuclear transport factor 2 family protein [Cyclobacteriaceae bacterium]
MKPTQLIQQWVQLFNKADADGLAALYHDDAINHKVANDPIYGRAAIKEMFAEEFSAADMTCIVEQIFEDGEWASWNGKIHWD